MAKAKSTAKPKAKPGEPNAVVVTYDLFDLPTAFHKAGLAGLVLLIESLKARRVLKADDAKYEMTATTATMTFTAPLIHKLMDDVYDAEKKQAAVKSKWKDAKVARPPTAGEKEAGTPFIYNVVQPKGRFLRDHYPDEDGLWLKMWRDMLWNIPRSRPTTREPYNQRAEKETCKEGPNAWANLLKVQKERARNGFHTSELTSALCPGAQAVNAEGVPFQGRAEQNLLLHFWPLTVLVFVPRFIDADGQSHLGKRRKDDKQLHFALTIPEVRNVAEFVHDYPKLLIELKTDARGFRPAQAVVDLPAEGAFAFLDHLASITKQSVETGELQYSIGSVEYVHLVKEGNNVKAMAVGRISPNSKLLVAYRAIVEPKEERGEPRFHNPLFRRGVLVALLDDEPWHRPFGNTLSAFKAELFVRQPRQSDDAVKGPPHFANDAARKFHQEARTFVESIERIKSMPNTDRPKAPLPVIVNRVVRSYLLTRTSDKTGIKLDQFKAGDDIDWSKVPTKFNDEKQKIAQSLFLEFRSRKEQAFVDHFAATFFSVTQRFAEADRLELSDVLVNTDRRDDLKTLTLLALSANS